MGCDVVVSCSVNDVVGVVDPVGDIDSAVVAESVGSFFAIVVIGVIVVEVDDAEDLLWSPFGGFSVVDKVVVKGVVVECVIGDICGFFGSVGSGVELESCKNVIYTIRVKYITSRYFNILRDSRRVTVVLLSTI